jgi:hypothetical protein
VERDYVIQIWKHGPTWRLDEVVERDDFDLRMSIARALRDETAMDAVSLRHDELFVLFCLPDSSDWRHWERLTHCFAWHEDTGWKVRRAYDEANVLPLLHTTKRTSGLKALYRKAKSAVGMQRVKSRWRAIHLRRLRTAQSEDTFRRLVKLYENRWCYRLKFSCEPVRALKDIRSLLPELSSASTEEDFVGLMSKARSSYCVRKIGLARDLKVIEQKRIERQSDPYYDWNLATASPDLGGCWSRRFKKELQLRFDQQIIIPQIGSNASDEKLCELWNEALSQETKAGINRLRDETSLAALKNQYGVRLENLPEDILIRPPRNLIGEIHKILNNQ